MKQMVGPGFNRWNQGESKVKIKFNQIKKSARPLEVLEEARQHTDVRYEPAQEAYAQLPEISRPNFTRTPTLEKAKVDLAHMRARRKNIATPPYHLGEDQPVLSRASSRYHTSPRRQGKSPMKILEAAGQSSLTPLQPYSSPLNLPSLKESPIKAKVAGNTENMSAFGIKVQNELNRVEGAPPLQQRMLVQKQGPGSVPYKGSVVVRPRIPVKNNK